MKEKTINLILFDTFLTLKKVRFWGEREIKKKNFENKKINFENKLKKYSL